MSVAYSQLAGQSEHIEGARLALPLLPALLPFGAIYAALAIESGFSDWQVLLASASIIAGASQYAMLDLLGQQVPAWSILLAVVAINARHVLYSAALGRGLAHFTWPQRLLAFFVLTDPAYAAAEQRMRGNRRLRPSFYFGYALCIYAFWLLGNLAGLVFGGLIDDPARFGLDYILPIYFLSLVVGFRDTSRFTIIALTSVVTSIVVWFSLGTPWHILLGGLSGLLIAAVTATASHGELSQKSTPAGESQGGGNTLNPDSHESID